ncbi:12970_t:CDS:2 [Ambispora leptoticha]|uniref:12970_t:CDS:1 n=1 Tax=Ambispora leptoticha TaxID=144679 RepID=A0A9N9D211_9GLOM|nr:12970_t:CDS:2 [Ambispora leptoticha]
MSEYSYESVEKHHKKFHETDKEELKKHESHVSHQLVAGAAAFEAFKLYQKKRNPDEKHSNAKAALAALVAAEADKLIETKGLDFVDKQKAHHQAKKAAEEMYKEKYGDDAL